MRLLNVRFSHPLRPEVCSLKGMKLRPALRALFLAIALSATPLAGQTPKGAVEQVKHPEITKLTLKGIESIPIYDVEQNISISESQCIGIALTPLCWLNKSKIFYKKAFLDREELARDMLRIRVLYYKHGFRNTTVDTVITRQSRDEVHVTLKINEGEPIMIADVTVNQTVPILRQRGIDRIVEVHKDQRLDLMLLDSTKARLISRVWGRGYADAVVDTAIVIDTAAKLAWVTINIDPKWQTRVKDITIYGNRVVEDSSILQSLLFKPGDLYKTSTMLESQRSLYESNLFRRAAIEIRGGGDEDGDSLKHVAVYVTEGPMQEARVSAGFNTVSFFEVGGRYTNYNWFGKARRFTIQGSLGNLFASGLNGHGIFYDVGKVAFGGDNPKYFKPTYTVSAESRRPWFLSPNNDIALGVFFNRRSVPGIYVDRGYGLSGTFTRRLATKATASANYRFEVTNIDAGEVYFCVNNGVCDDATLAALRTNRRLSPLAFSSAIDRTNNSLQPRRGWRGQVDAEVATSFTVSDFKYERVSADAAKFFAVGRSSVVALHLRSGFVKPIQSNGNGIGKVLHPRKRFYAGGSQSVRGFGESQLGPRVLTIPAATLRADTIGCASSTLIEDCDPNNAAYAVGDFDPRALGGNALLEGSVEYRFPLFYDLTGAIFMDAAYLLQTINDSLPRSRTAVTPGFGVRYLTAVGPIRVDLGINPVTKETLPVITEEVTDSGRILTHLKTNRIYQPSSGSGFRKITSRLRLHLSIGEAF